METLVVNLLGKAVPEVIGGRDYLVAPMTIIVSGVLPGSKGPLFYPPEDIRNSAGSWDGVPVTLNHPRVGSKYVLARGNQFVLSRFGMGHLRNTLVMEDPVRLLTEGCFDVARTRKLASNVLVALREGTPLELSTGLEASYHPVANGAEYNGRSFSHIARDYAPDHLAVLPSGRGACSLADGCGVLINSAGQLVLNEAGLLSSESGELLPIPSLLVVNPYTNEHSARIEAPARFIKTSFSRKEISPGISLIVAKKEPNGPMLPQSYRFKADLFSAKEARKWLKEHKIKVKEFTAATGSKSAVKNESTSFPARTGEGSEMVPSPESAPFWKVLLQGLGLVSVQNLMSDNDLRNKLSVLLKKKFSTATGASVHGMGGTMSEYDSYSTRCHVQDVYEDYVVFRFGEGLYSIGYSVSGSDDVSLSDEEPSEVKVVTSYETVNEGADDPPNPIGPDLSAPPTSPMMNSDVSLKPGEISMPLTPEKKGEIIRTLLANCSCDKVPWKGLNDVALNAISDDRLQGWAESVPLLPPSPLPAAAPPVSGSGHVFGQDAQGNRYVLNTATGQINWVTAPGASPSPSPAPAAPSSAGSGIPVAMPVRNNGLKTADELATLLPAAEQHRWNQFTQTREQRRNTLIDQLVANANVDPLGKSRLSDWCRSKDLEELETIALFTVPMATETSPTFNFTGAVGGAATFAPPVLEPPLESPVHIFEKRRRAS